MRVFREVFLQLLAARLRTNAVAARRSSAVTLSPRSFLFPKTDGLGSRILAGISGLVLRINLSDFYSVALLSAVTPLLSAVKLRALLGDRRQPLKDFHSTFTTVPVVRQVGGRLSPEMVCWVDNKYI